MQGVGKPLDLHPVRVSLPEFTRALRAMDVRPLAHGRVYDDQMCPRNHRHNLLVGEGSAFLPERRGIGRNLVAEHNAELRPASSGITAAAPDLDARLVQRSQSRGVGAHEVTVTASPYAVLRRPDIIVVSICR